MFLELAFHDHLRWDMAASTLFLIGSRTAFDLESRPVRQLHIESCREHW